MAQDVTVRGRAHGGETIEASASERTALSKLEVVLDNQNEQEDQSHPILLGVDGETIELPSSVVQGLRQIVSHLLKDRALTVVPLHKELTSQEAADLLNVSRPFLIGLLEQGAIPYVRTGKHRRIRLNDVLEYKKQRDASRRQALDRLTELSQDYGLDRYQD